MSSSSSDSDSSNEDFTPAADKDQEMSDDEVIVLDKNGPAKATQQQFKNFRERFIKMEMELKETKNLHMITKLELENVVLQERMKHQKMMVKLNTLQAKMLKMEQDKEQAETEKNASVDQITKLNTEQQRLFQRISTLEKINQQQNLFYNFQQNYWDANSSNGGQLAITDDNCLTVHYNKYDIYFRSIFAKYPVLLNIGSTDTFYFEISIINMERYADFGFATNTSDGAIRMRKGTYAYSNSGAFCINNVLKLSYAKYAYGAGDTVGCGVDLASRRIFLTKNGTFLESFELVLPSNDLPLIPFVTLWSYDDKIEANFGPKFEFNLATL
ncbi:hypothetical protein niasHT_032579 [Heterodera trifolii]|uniref:B30.2/SPRY domain-containing protein n=1 Tax=Heterodera trifolii TaxID=157864 RepID=A0ABD2IJR5_9BILA